MINKIKITILSALMGISITQASKEGREKIRQKTKTELYRKTLSVITSITNAMFIYIGISKKISMYKIIRAMSMFNIIIFLIIKAEIKILETIYKKKQV